MNKNSNAKIKIKVLSLLIIFIVQSLSLFAQDQYVPADIHAVGDRNWRRMGIMNGNMVGTVYFNTGQVSKDKTMPQLEWPVGSGHIYMDTVIPIVAAETVDANGSIIHPVESNYEIFPDLAPDGLTEWGWQPLPGYLNPAQGPHGSPAISHKKETWPEIWPDRPDWGSDWNGYFGRGIINADQETYYVVDDDADEEFECYPDSADSTRRGLGMRMSVRGLQWSHVLAEDCIFWIYNVYNVGTTDYEKVLFGMFIDSKNGGHDLDNGFYDTYIDLTYIWDQRGIGTWGGPTGWIGYGYLESPGEGHDGKDNDEDGLTDENRDSGPGEWIFGSVGRYGPEKWHWSGDEDGDWNPEIDDVGADGLGPLNANYPGPDKGEGDGIPTDGEPNFDRTDLDESDQVGLEAVSLHVLGEYPVDKDELIWDLLSNHVFDQIQNLSNIGVFYSSGPFPLKAKQTESFSVALLLGEDFDDLVRNKDIVQRIFNANYRFAKPPDKPTVKAIAGDGCVTLTWDNVAEFSRDPFLGIDPDSLGYKKDFEGYVIYKSTDPGLLDTRLITDAYGNKVFRIPEAQFDLKNGEKGISLIGLPNGAHFYLGDDTGMSHIWIDTNVVNGRTYYYAVVSYDAGVAKLGSGSLPPSECTSIIERDIFGNIFTDINTVVITPRTPAAGYKLPELLQPPDHISGNGKGRIEISIIYPDEFNPDKTYRVTFNDTVISINNEITQFTIDYSVYCVEEDTFKVYRSPYLDSLDIYPLFDGIGVRTFNNENAPFTDEDVFEFKTGEEATINQQKARSDLDRIAAVPNPYIVANLLETKNPLITSGRGERVIQFIHLPQKCTIRIYTIRGSLVDIIEHNSTINDGIEKWGLVSKDGIDIAYGVYVFHVEAEGIGNKIGKFAVIK